jgi:hypothetical protein
MGNEDGVAFKSPFCRSFNHYLRNPKINGAAGYCEHFRGLTMSRTCLNRHNVGMLGTTTDTWEFFQMMFHIVSLTFRKAMFFPMNMNHIYLKWRIWIFPATSASEPLRVSWDIREFFCAGPPVTSPSFPKGLVAKGDNGSS